ncbi:ATP synthase F1 subunit delta [Treponema primitia]|uniref:ATP synthase F1 subunit delta n=1 Tax=Treponema primitia TaxID=88058 RepID=UPI00025552A5|nr:ATP synthase F1 subunit delta [Treponema primitia]
MFQGDRWADAFLAACGTSSEASGNDCTVEALDALKVFVPSLSHLPGRISGVNDALRLEKVLRSALESSGAGLGAEYALRFVVLLVRRGQIKYLNAALRAVEQRIDAKNGVVSVNVESVRPLDTDLQEKIKAGLKKRYGARDIKLGSQIVPELLGGYRLRIGTELIDSSLKGQIQKMARELHAASDGGFR